MKEQVSVDKKDFGWDDFCKECDRLKAEQTHVTIEKTELQRLKRLDENVKKTINALDTEEFYICRCLAHDTLTTQDIKDLLKSLYDETTQES